MFHPITNAAAMAGGVEIERIVEHRDVVLRVGLVHGDRLICDRAFTDRKVTIGPEKRADLVLDEDYGGPSVRFVRQSDGSVSVTAPRVANLRLARGQHAPADAGQLLASGVADQQGDTVTVIAPVGSRGRLVMGPYMLLFQVVRRRVRVPVLPNRGLVKRLTGAIVADPVWSACLAMSMLLVGSLAAQAILFHRTTNVYLQHARAPEDVPHERPIEYIEVVAEVEPPADTPALAPTTPVEPAPKATPDPVKPKPTKPTLRAKKPDPRPDSDDITERDRDARTVKEEVARKTIAGAFDTTVAGTKLFASDDASGAATQGTVFGNERADTDGPSAMVVRPNGGGGSVVLEKVKTSRPKWDRTSGHVASTGTKKVEKIIDVRLSPIKGTADKPENKNRIVSVIRRKNGAVRRCYESALRSNAGLSGKVQVWFMVGMAGTVTQVRVTGADGDFGDCIARKFKAIRGLPQLSAPASFTQSYVFTRDNG